MAKKATKKKTTKAAAKKKTAAKKTTKTAKATKTKKTKAAKVDDEAATKKKAAKKKPAKKAKRKSRAKKDEDARQRLVWTVFNHAMKPVAKYAFNQKKAAEKRARELSPEGKLPHFVAKVKEVIEEE
ncbi:MAG: hypothetical protein ACR2NP_00245 [Pirellulaceae bacterium]